MTDRVFDEYAAQYDSWFLKNRNVLQSEVELLAGCLRDPGKALSVGCGSGLFEMILRDAHGIDIHFGVEPAEGMAEIAVKRGMEVQVSPAENLPFDDWDKEILVAVSPPASMAIKQAWLYQNLIKSIDEVVETNKQLEEANKEVRQRVKELNWLKSKVAR